MERSRRALRFGGAASFPPEARGSLPPNAGKAYGSARVSRPDLLALSPESIASLANLGLVKRALREIAAGEGPVLAEDEAGVVTGTFNDGVTAKLVPGMSLRETPCSCGAVTVCRHRVAVALAYPSFAAKPAAERPSALTDGSVEASNTLPHVAWSPAEITDDELRRALGRRAMDRAEEIARAGLAVEIRPASAGEVNAARLPTCAVRFNVPSDLAYARCDCALPEPCEHIALAAWAFREAAKAPLVPKTVELRRGPVAEAPPHPLKSALDLACEILIEGVASASHLAPRFALARAELAAASLVWPASILTDLELSLEAYRDRSARYSASVAASLITELAARSRAAEQNGELSARFVLGADEAKETLLEKVRLISLGARVFADGRDREAEVYLADPSSSVVLVLRRRFAFPEPALPEAGPDLAARRIAGKISFGSLASGQMVSRSLKRLANREAVLPARGDAKTSVTPHEGDFSALPPSLLVRDPAEFERSLRALPPRMLRPRVLAESTRAVEIAGVRSIYYRPGEQELRADLETSSGGSIRLVKRHASATPGAVDAVAGALTGEARVRFVSGAIRRDRSGLVIEPAALVTDRVIVPDLERARPLGLALPAPPPSADIDPLAAAAEQADALLEEACHIGLARVSPGWSERASEVIARLDRVGLRSVASLFARLLERVLDLRRDRSCAGALASAWLSASIRLALLREAL